MQDVAARISNGADIVHGGFQSVRKSSHVGERIALPAHPADLGVIVRVPVSANVEPGNFLRAQKGRYGILVLLAVVGVYHRLKKTSGTEHRVVPLRPRQRSDD